VNQLEHLSLEARVEHFRAYAGLMVFDDGVTRDPEPWQMLIAADIFRGFREVWEIVPEGNGKSTFLAQLALYGADFSDSPWIPVGAASAKQARIIYDQAEGFVERSPDLQGRFRCFGGYLRIASKANGGKGIEVFAAEKKTGDGVIPYPFAIVDELHRHDDLGLYSLWKGKLRKRGAQILTISTAGEPETPFENARDEIRRRATRRDRVGSHLRAEGPGLVLHEWMVESDEACSDMAAVKAANPLQTITEAGLAEDFASPTMDLGAWKRLKCNRPTRSVQSAITDKEWDDAETTDEIPAGAEIDVGLDVAFKWDTTALVPLYQTPGYRLLGPATVLIPPRDGSSMHPDEIKNAFLELTAEYRVGTVVMDIHNAEDIAAWIEDDLHVTVIDRQQGNKAMVADYNAFMDGLRNGTLKHTGCSDLRSHVLHAIARRLPGGDYRFDRHSTARTNVREQDRRVIDALTAAAMVVEHASRQKTTTSIYDEMYT
jgi:phage terminase large subunit-like protein